MEGISERYEERRDRNATKQRTNSKAQAQPLRRPGKLVAKIVNEQPGMRKGSALLDMYSCTASHNAANGGMCYLSYMSAQNDRLVAAVTTFWPCANI